MKRNRQQQRKAHEEFFVFFLSRGVKMLLRLRRRPVASSLLTFILFYIIFPIFTAGTIRADEDNDEQALDFFDDFFAENYRDRILLAPPHPSQHADYWTQLDDYNSKVDYAMGHLEQVPLMEDRPGAGEMSNLQYGLWHALDANSEPLVEALLKDKRVDPSDWDNLPIRLCSKRGQYQLVSLLLQDRRVDPGARHSVALQSAINANYPDVAVLLLQSGRVNPNDCPALDLFTPIIYQFNQTAVFRELVVSGRYLLDNVKIKGLFEMCLAVENTEMLEMLFPRLSELSRFMQQELLQYACLVTREDWIVRLFRELKIMEIIAADKFHEYLLLLVRRQELNAVRQLLELPRAAYIMQRKSLSPQFIRFVTNTAASPQDDRIIDEGRTSFTEALRLFLSFYAVKTCETALASAMESVADYKQSCLLFSRWFVRELEGSTVFSVAQAGQLLGCSVQRERLIHRYLFKQWLPHIITIQRRYKHRLNQPGATGFIRSQQSFEKNAQQ
jgi:hypothetical protein